MYFRYSEITQPNVNVKPVKPEIGRTEVQNNGKLNFDLNPLIKVYLQKLRYSSFKNPKPTYYS